MTATGNRLLEAALLLGLVLGPAAGAAAAATCPAYANAVKTGRIADSRITEISGLAASATNPGVLWLHNDSGDEPRLFAISATGALRGVLTLEATAAIDWEDLAIGPGPRAGVDYLYIGDIGDNGARRRPYVTVYRLEEPTIEPLADDAEPIEAKISEFTSFDLQYPDGPRDAEVLLSDPTTGDLFIVSKDFGSGESFVYRFRYPHERPSDPDQRITLEVVGRIQFRGSRAGGIAVTAGDISPSGDKVIMRTYTQTLVWSRATRTRLAHELMTVPCPVTGKGLGLPFDQFESIAYSVDGRSYYTVSEGKNRAIYRFDILDDE